MVDESELDDDAALGHLSRLVQHIGAEPFIGIVNWRNNLQYALGDLYFVRLYRPYVFFLGELVS